MIKMKKKHITLIGIMTLIAIFIIGCLPSTPVFNYRTGTKGLTLTIDGPDEIIMYEGDATPHEEYEFKIKNDGATDIDQNDVYLKIQFKEGFLKLREDGSTYKSISSLNDFNFGTINHLMGKNKYSNNGEEISYFTVLEAISPPNQGVSATINADLCYRYKTILSDTICVNSEKITNGGCSVMDHSYSSGQGAPIKISKVEVRDILLTNRKVTPKIIITVENAEGGIVSLAGGDSFKEGCLAKSDINKVTIESVALGNNELNCDIPSNIINFDEDGERKVSCEAGSGIPTDPQGYYDTPIYIELSYGYHTMASMKVDIIRKNY